MTDDVLSELSLNVNRRKLHLVFRESVPKPLITEDASIGIYTMRVSEIRENRNRILQPVGVLMTKARTMLEANLILELGTQADVDGRVHTVHLAGPLIHLTPHTRARDIWGRQLTSLQHKLKDFQLGRRNFAICPSNCNLIFSYIPEFDIT